MMVNTHRKGLTAENEARERLKSEEWQVYKPPWTQWGQKDVFGLFDLIAVHIEHGWKLIQVKSYGPNTHGDGLTALKKKLATFLPYAHGASIELWIRRKGRWRGRGKNKHFEPTTWETHLIKE